MISKGTFYTVLNGIAQFVKAISSLIINKVILYAVIGASIAFAGTYFLYLLLVVIYFGKRFRFFEKD